jgi:type II secretory pathway pseudopilin PulG
MPAKALPPWLQQLLIVLVILASASTIGLLQWRQLQTLQAQIQKPSEAEIRREVAAEQLRLALLQNSPSFGFDNLIADWTFLNFLQYFGDTEARRKTDYTLSPEFFEVILKRDPYFLQSYNFLSTSSSIYAGLPDRSIRLMKTALESLKPGVLPNAYQGWRQLGIDQLLFNGDAEAARQSFLRAAELAAQSPLPESQASAQFSRQTADFLAKNPDSKTAQVAAWVMVLSNAPDDRTRQTARQRVEDLGGKIIPNPDGTFAVQPPAQD